MDHFSISLFYWRENMGIYTSTHKRVLGRTLKLVHKITWKSFALYCLIIQYVNLLIHINVGMFSVYLLIKQDVIKCNLPVIMISLGKSNQCIWLHWNLDAIALLSITINSPCNCNCNWPHVCTWQHMDSKDKKCMQQQLSNFCRL